MTRDDDFSEERLNAFVDGELASEESSRMYDEASRSLELEQRLCQQRTLKELVRHAYGEVPAAEGRSSRPSERRSLFGWSLVAGVLIAVGLTGGYLGHDYIRRMPEQDAVSMAAQTVAEPDNYLLHVISNDPAQMYAALEYASFLLDSEGGDEVGRVEIVANEKGLDLVRSDVTPYAAEIARLQERNVVFYACSRTIERLEEDGVDVKLVPDTHEEYTALDRVVMRMQQGWKYQKI
jgi:intracellular sulfur oxidation DsrE/DsrF family protein